MAGLSWRGEGTPSCAAAAAGDIVPKAHSKVSAKLGSRLLRRISISASAPM
jgi:hypothetical protein